MGFPAVCELDEAAPLPPLAPTLAAPLLLLYPVSGRPAETGRPGTEADMSGCHMDDAALASADGVGGCEPPVGSANPPSENFLCCAECTSLSHEARRTGRWAGMLLTECRDMVIGALVSWSSSDEATASESGVDRLPGPRDLPSIGAILPITCPVMMDVVAADMANCWRKPRHLKRKLCNMETCLLPQSRLPMARQNQGAIRSEIDTKSTRPKACMATRK
jgi:hypothetical protein